MDSATAPSEWTKDRAIAAFRDHVSAAKADFWLGLGIDFVPGRREGPYIWDMDGGKRLINLHTNGGTFNLGHRHPEIINTLIEGLTRADIGNGHLFSRYRAELGNAIADRMPEDLDVTVFGVSGSSEPQDQKPIIDYQSKGMG
jgi:acetylornithine/succinyldiaminopimelate/putrescine aminotransferase